MRRLLAKSPQLAQLASMSCSKGAGFDRIPKRFQLGPHTITVKIVNEAEMHEASRRYLGGTDECHERLYGLTVFDEGLIFVRRVTPKFTKAMQMHAFWHEYFHILLHRAHRERLSLDETLVDNLGAMQLQALQTMKF